jgi:hypothetical protein
MAKEKVSADERFEKQDFDLFEALNAIDKKDYSYYDRLTPEQRRKFVPFMMLQWISAVKGNADLQSYYLQSVEYHANKYFFNENVYKNPKLQWLMLCAASPGLGKQYHQWIPQINQNVSRLKSPAKLKDIKEYFKKVYPTASTNDIEQISEVYVANHKRKMYLAEKFPTLKFDEIELLSDLITDEDIKQYEEDWGN